MAVRRSSRTRSFEAFRQQCSSNHPLPPTDLLGVTGPPDLTTAVTPHAIRRTEDQPGRSSVADVRPNGSKCADACRSSLSLGVIMAWRICLVAWLSLGLLGGCASVGNESIADATYETVSAQLIKGKTRQQQVRELYGDRSRRRSPIAATKSGNTISPECTRSLPTSFPT
jgi:hypothetical protein